MTESQIAFGFVGVVLVLISLPLCLRRVRPNPLYGLRTPAAMGDERVWFEANARSGLHLLIIGALLVVLGVLPVDEEDALAAYLQPMSIALLVLGPALTAWLGWRRANRLARTFGSGAAGPSGGPAV